MCVHVCMCDLCVYDCCMYLCVCEVCVCIGTDPPTNKRISSQTRENRVLFFTKKRKYQSGVTLTRRCITIRTRLQQHVGSLIASFVRCPHQCCVAVIITCVNVAPRLQKPLHCCNLSMKSCENQRSASVCVPDMHVCALFNEKIHNTNFAYLPRQEAD